MDEEQDSTLVNENIKANALRYSQIYNNMQP